MATQEDFDKFYFTFHYVSINTRMLTPEYLRQITLHSTMFLLILPWRTSISKHAVFTFHYVSINTDMRVGSAPVVRTLHSTMFLLILFLPVPASSSHSSFTLHYVSINTRSSEPPINSSILYHILSTMVFFYLFIYFDITRFTGSTILLMFFTFVDLS